LGISVETVKEHAQNIFRKIGATNRTEAAIWAVRQSLVGSNGAPVALEAQSRPFTQ
jgi:hypothetical protein